MRELTTAESVERFMLELGRIATTPTSIFFTGGVTALLHGWRAATIDVDLKIIPDSDQILRAIPALKESLQINVELASPDNFIPELPGWRDRCLFIKQVGAVAFFHYDLYSQAISKIERGHAQDITDVSLMISGGFVDPHQLQSLFDRIEPELYKFPAIDPPSLKRAITACVQEAIKKPGDS